MTAEEHLEWAKARALEYVERLKDPEKAFLSLARDLTKHEGTRDYVPEGFVEIRDATPEQAAEWLRGLKLPPSAEEHLAAVKAKALALLETNENPGIALLAFGVALQGHPAFPPSHPSYRRGVTLIREGVLPLIREGVLLSREQARAFIESVQVNEEPVEDFPGAPGEGDHVHITMIRVLRLGTTTEGIVFIQANIQGETVNYGLTDEQVLQLLDGLARAVVDRKERQQPSPREPSKEKRMFTWDA